MPLGRRWAAIKRPTRRQASAAVAIAAIAAAVAAERSPSSGCGGFVLM